MKGLQLLPIYFTKFFILFKKCKLEAGMESPLDATFLFFLVKTPLFTKYIFDKQTEILMDIYIS